MELGIGVDDDPGKNVEVHNSDIGSTIVVNVDAESASIPGVDDLKNIVKEVPVSSAKDNVLLPLHVDATGSIHESVQGDKTNKKENDDYISCENSENFSTNEEIKEAVEEVEERNDREDIVTSKMESVSVVKDEQHIPVINDGDSFAAKSEDSTIRQPQSSETIETYTPLLVTNSEIIVSRTLQQ
ncbi:Glutamine synthetase [Bienertia sinuspersici]